MLANESIRNFSLSRFTFDNLERKSGNIIFSKTLPGKMSNFLLLGERKGRREERRGLMIKTWRRVLQEGHE